MSSQRHPLVELTLARLREFVREPGAIFWTFGFPVVLAVVLGIAFRQRPPEVLEVAVTGDPAAIEAVMGVVGGTGGVHATRASGAQARKAHRTGKVDLVVVASNSKGGPEIVYRYDEHRLQGRAARNAVEAALLKAQAGPSVSRSKDERITDPGGRYIDFLLPGLIGLNVMGSSMWGIGYSVVLERRRKLLKRLAATPMRRSHFLLSYMFSRVAFLVAEVGLLVLFGWLVFGVSVRGSVVLVGLIAMAGGVSFAGLALLTASRTESTEVASGIMNAVMLPMWLLSGSFFSYERFPQIAHPFIRALPLTALNDALRAVVNEGAGLFDTLPSIGILAAWGVAGFVLALRLFRWH